MLIAGDGSAASDHPLPFRRRPCFDPPMAGFRGREEKMQFGYGFGCRKITRRTMLATAGAVAAVPALAAECRIGPEPHEKGPLVFMDYDQVELDAAYNQEVYEPLLDQVGMLP
jgi:hypothetical protein